MWQPAVYNSKPLQDIVHNQLDVNKIKTSKRKLRIGATGLSTGAYQIFTESNDNIQDAVIASSAFPAMLLPIKMLGQLWSDGGCRSITPLKAAIQAGATEVDIVLCSAANDPANFSGSTTAIDVAQRAIDLMCDQIIVDDLKICGLHNKLVLAGQETDKKHINVRLIQPAQNLTQNSLDFSQAAIQPMMKQGYEDAKRVLTQTP